MRAVHRAGRGSLQAEEKRHSPLHNLLVRWCGCVYQRVLREEDTPREEFRRAIFFATSAVFCIYASAILFTFALGPISKGCVTCGMYSIGLAAWAVATQVYLQTARPIPANFVDKSLLYMFAVVTIPLDFLGVTTGHSRYYPWFIFLISNSLVFECSAATRGALTWGTIVWLALVNVDISLGSESGFLSHVEPYMASQEIRICACDTPRCGMSASFAVTNTVTEGILVLLSYSLAVGFASTVAEEKRKTAAAVDAARHIARMLADFDLATAAAYLDAQAATLPDELMESFATLLSNLQSYRPYLPDELFTSSHAAPADVPGTAGQHVALVFTDIKESTRLWDLSGPVMAASLDVHNATLRAAIDAHSGYEVKTIGDAFMVAFHTSMAAIRFGCAAQVGLGEVRWPSGLMRGGDDGFGTLTIRAGVHCGEVSAQQNMLTGRYDHFGPTVNRAARVEPFGAPGAVTVTEEVLEDIGDEGDAAQKEVAEAFVTIPYGSALSGKGLSEPLRLTALLPRALLMTEEAVRQAVTATSGRPGSFSRQVSLAALSEFDETSHVSCPSGRSSDPLSSSSSSVPCLALSVRNPPRTLRTAARAATATVGVVKYDAVEAATDASTGFVEAQLRATCRLQMLQSAVQATSGQLSSVVNGVAVVSWGLHGGSVQHLQESAQCMILLQTELGERNGDGAGPFWAGLATGPVATAELAASAARRYVTLFGTCVDLGFALCYGAAELGVQVLVAAADGEGHARHLGQVLRLVEQWDLGAAGGPAAMVDVHELLRQPGTRSRHDNATSMVAVPVEERDEHAAVPHPPLQHAVARFHLSARETGNKFTLPPHGAPQSAF